MAVPTVMRPYSLMVFLFSIHKFFEIYYMISGSCSYFIDNKTYQVTEGDIILIPEGIIHRTDYDGKEHERMLIECDVSLIPENARAELHSIGRLYRNPKARPKLHDYLMQLECEHRSPDVFSDDARRLLLRLFFYTLLRNKSMLTPGDGSVSMSESVVNYIQENYAQEIKLSELAKMHFVSQEHLSRSFKRDTGFCFSEFLTLVRLQHAENMLKERSGKTISEIAYACGFNDSNYFSDKFKRAYGIPPLKYCKQYGDKR